MFKTAKEWIEYSKKKKEISGPEFRKMIQLMLLYMRTAI